jgi:hypothetical protein
VRIVVEGKWELRRGAVGRGGREQPRWSESAAVVRLSKPNEEARTSKTVASSRTGRGASATSGRKVDVSDCGFTIRDIVWLMSHSA